MHERMASPHRRRNALTGEYVLVSPHRLERPWLGERRELPSGTRAAYDPQCYLCPGNSRANGRRNPEYERTFLFDNDYPALTPGTNGSAEDGGLFVAAGESGRCRVLCFSPRHDLDIGTLSAGALRGVVDAWADQYEELGAQPNIAAVTIFENRGEMMGASNPHPHGQIWAEGSVPVEMSKESIRQQEYRERCKCCLLCEYARAEIEQAERVVFADERICVVVPFWAEWPFETLVLPLRHVASLVEMDAGERASLAASMADLVSRYDRLFATQFPYSMGFHQRPTDGAPHPEWHAHAHYYPPLLRSASIRKYMVGYEMLAQPQRDLTAESAAGRLRSA
jgi:UDPglucose--hexose-1-phosphate uridylyltransferase